MKNNDSTTIKSTRNNCFNFFEALASIFIVFIHMPFPGVVGEMMEGLARFAVPFFFTISGFYLIKKDMSILMLRSKLVSRIKRISKIALFSFALYFILLGSQALVSGSFSNWFNQTFNGTALLKLVLFNNPLLMVTNWFLVALLFSYFIIYLFPASFINGKKTIKIITCTLPIWIIVRLIMLMLKIKINGYLLADATYYRTWYATGLPFICFGILLKQYEEKLKSISKKVIYLGLIISALEMTIANYLFIHLFGDSITYYCGSIFVVFFIMCLATQQPTLFNKIKIVNIAGNWTMLLYIFHPAVIGIVQTVISSLGMSSINFVLWLEPLLVLVISLLLAIGINFLMVKIKTHRRAINKINII